MPYNLSRQLLCPLTACTPRARAVRHKAKRVYHVYGDDGFDGIREELVERGPLQATFTVYEDFMSYSSGIYRHATGRKIGQHAVKVIGYGHAGANGTEPFWIAMNSWGTSFGINGTFLIGAGDSGTGFELQMLAGEPCVPGDPYPC